MRIRAAAMAGSACVLLGRLNGARVVEALLGFAAALTNHLRQHTKDRSGKRACGLPEVCLTVPERFNALLGIATVPACKRVRTRVSAVAGSACVLLGRGLWSLDGSKRC